MIAESENDDQVVERLNDEIAKRQEFLPEDAEEGEEPFSPEITDDQLPVWQEAKRLFDRELAGAEGRAEKYRRAEARGRPIRYSRFGTDLDAWLQQPDVKAPGAIAQMFGEFRAGNPMLPRYRRIFAKVRDFLTRLANALRGLGFNSVESIFAKVESGAVGRRPEGYGMRAAEGEARYAADEMQMPASVEENIRRGADAMDRVIVEHTDVRQAMYRPEVGWISFFWGTPGASAERFARGKGVSHIIARRNIEGRDGEAIARAMVETIARGEIGTVYDRPDGTRRMITFGRYVAILDLQHTVTGDVWLLTGYEESRRVRTGPGAAGQPVATDQSYAPQPRGSSDEAGAGPSESIGSEGEGDNPPSGSDTKYSLFTRAAAASNTRAAKAVGWTERLGQYLSPLGALPQKNRYLARRYLALGEVAEAEDLGRKVYDTFKRAGRRRKAGALRLPDDGRRRRLDGARGAAQRGGARQGDDRTRRPGSRPARAADAGELRQVPGRIPAAPLPQVHAARGLHPGGGGRPQGLRSRLPAEAR